MATTKDESTTKRLMKVDEFAESLNVTRSCVRRWVLERRVKVIKLGRLVRIPASEVDRLMTGGLCTGPTHARLTAVPAEPGNIGGGVKP
jgi:excisionase family DNA binding protein